MWLASFHRYADLQTSGTVFLQLAELSALVLVEVAVFDMSEITSTLQEVQKNTHLLSALCE